MATIDLSTIDIYYDEHRLEAYVPFTQKSVGDLLKNDFKARFKTDAGKKRWVVEFQFCRSSPEDIVAAVEEELYKTAIKGWRGIVDKFRNYACASKRYEVKFTAGGIRIMLPGGHPLHYHLGLIYPKEKPVRDTWRIPGSMVDGAKIAEMLMRIAEEDRNIFIDATEPYENRSATGRLLLKWSEAGAFGLGDDGIVFANYSFVKTIDPTVQPMQIHAWPYRVTKASPTEGGIEATLTYMEPKAGSRAVGALMALPQADRRPLLDEAHVDGKWKVKSYF